MLKLLRRAILLFTAIATVLSLLMVVQVAIGRSRTGDQCLYYGDARIDRRVADPHSGRTVSDRRDFYYASDLHLPMVSPSGRYSIYSRLALEWRWEYRSHRFDTDFRRHEYHRVEFVLTDHQLKEERVVLDDSARYHYIRDLDWFPDSDRLVYLGAIEDEQTEVGIIDVQGTTLAKTVYAGVIFSYVYHSESFHIILSSHNQHPSYLTISSLNPTTLTVEHEHKIEQPASAPVFSPTDTNLFAYPRLTDQGIVITIASLSGQTKHIVIGWRHTDIKLVWSPDGKWIALHTFDGVIFDVVGLNGTYLRGVNIRTASTHVIVGWSEYKGQVRLILNKLEKEVAKLISFHPEHNTYLDIVPAHTDQRYKGVVPHELTPRYKHLYSGKYRVGVGVITLTSTSSQEEAVVIRNPFTEEQTIIRLAPTMKIINISSVQSGQWIAVHGYELDPNVVPDNGSENRLYSLTLINMADRYKTVKFSSPQYSFQPFAIRARQTVSDGNLNTSRHLSLVLKGAEHTAWPPDRVLTFIDSANTSAVTYFMSGAHNHLQSYTRDSVAHIITSGEPNVVRDYGSTYFVTQYVTNYWYTLAEHGYQFYSSDGLVFEFALAPLNLGAGYPSQFQSTTIPDRLDKIWLDKHIPMRGVFAWTNTAASQLQFAEVGRQPFVIDNPGYELREVSLSPNGEFAVYKSTNGLTRQTTFRLIKWSGEKVVDHPIALYQEDLSPFEAMRWSSCHSVPLVFQPYPPG